MKWVPKFLNADHKCQRCQSSEQSLEFFASIQMISCCDWRWWTKPGYIAMTRRQSNSQWSVGIPAHRAPNNSECKNPLEKFSPSFFGIIDCLPKGHAINAENYSSLLVQLKGILTEKHGGNLKKWSCSCTIIARHTVPDTNGRSQGTATMHFFKTSIGFHKSTVASSS